MKTVLKIALGIVLGCTVLIVGCVALIGAGIDEAQDESDEAAITQADYASVKTGAQGNTRKRLIDRFGEPAQQHEFETEGITPDDPIGSECIYYNREGELAALYQFCIDAQTGRVESKSSF